ncbi:hypothetical protein TrLO_g1008 [Triparma laevis f. longispina]|uniref:Methyltransferase domain-containing protein n=1 Tax=Triparma laevis f. longispina TaxID=1714387 RepID=A0A9W7EBZ0_9STRA|nr:hypothetical protein TrLO_g1008 [Triparma laevis f. longispina]
MSDQCLATISQVQALYNDACVTKYAEMMDADVGAHSEDLRLFLDGLLPGIIADGSCGTGHLLEVLAGPDSTSRELLGLDLSPSMVAFATSKVPGASMCHCDMRDAGFLAEGAAAGIVNCFAIHHVTYEDAKKTFAAGHQALKRPRETVFAEFDMNMSFRIYEKQ